MATVLQSDSRRLYSWWWDSHISPKNSKWLQENLTDMDTKVKAMIKLIEEDADSFARRAEMYYKKRPELMKLVEEFYRAYRALAERYDHATGELRHAHRAMAQAFPNQVPLVLPDDSTLGYSEDEREPHTPEMPHPLRSLLDSDDLDKAVGLIAKNGPFSGESNTLIGKKGLKQLHEIFGGGLEKEEKGKSSNDGIQKLKKALDDMHSEKEAVLLQYKQSVEKLSNLEGELNCAQMTSRGLCEEASKAAVEVQSLKEALVKLEAERDTGFAMHKEFLERISNLEIVVSQAQKDAQGLNERAVRAETEAKCLEKELSRSETAKDAGLLQYKQCLEKISDLERKLSLALEEARLLYERAERAETEVRELKKALSEINEETKAAASRYEDCLEIISKLESELSSAQEEIRCLNNVVLMETSKLKSAEEKCVLIETSNQSLRVEADNLAKKIAMKDEELSKKHEVLDKLQACVDNEHLRFVQVEATLQTLQNLHSQSQEEQKALALELKNVLQMLKDLEITKNGLEDENRVLNELNSSSAVSMDNLQGEILRLGEMKERLEEELRLHMGQTSSLQQEIYNLKEEIQLLNNRYEDLMEQVKSVGLNPESIGSSVKDLQNENSKLRQVREDNRDEKEALLKKLDGMKELLDKNSIWECSVTNLSGELNGTREKVKELEESCQLLNGEKSALVSEKAALLSHLQIIMDNMQKLVEKNTLLENSLSGANVELEGLRAKSKGLEELCNMLNDDKSNLLKERGTLVFQLENVERRLENLERRMAEMERKYVGLEKEKESTLSQVEELKLSLGVEKQERASFALASGARLTCLENYVQLLQEETRWRRKEFEEEVDKAVNAQFEIFILQKFIEDMEQKNYSLKIECQKHIEASKFAETLISELESENLEQQVEAELLLDEIEKVRMGICKMFKALGVGLDVLPDDRIANEQIFVNHAIDDIKDMKCAILDHEDNKQQLLVENSVLLTLIGQLRLEGVEIASQKKTLEQELEIMIAQLVMVENEKHKLIEMKRQLKSDNAQLVEENKCLLKDLSELEEENFLLEEENDSIILEALERNILSMVFKSFGSEKAAELKLLCGVNGDLEKEISVLSEELEMRETENLLLKESGEKLEKELHEVREVNSQLMEEISTGNNFLCQKETELLEAIPKLKAKEELNSELCKTVDGLKRQHENLEMHIVKLSEENMRQNKDIECLLEVNGYLESELGISHAEIEDHRIREENLSSELQEISNEFEIWESEATTFYFDLQVSSVREILFENKVHELTGVCESLENESASKTVEIEKMKERVGFMETEIGELKTQLFAYAPAIESLRDNIASLEGNILSPPDLDLSENLETKDVSLAVHLHEEICQELMEAHKSMIPNGIPELQKLQTRIKAFEKVLTKEMKGFSTEKTPNTSFELESSAKEIEELSSDHSFGSVKYKQREEMDYGNELNGKLKLLKTRPEVTGRILMKDIPLDHGSNASIFALSRRSRRRTDDQMLELWETAEAKTLKSSHKKKKSVGHQFDDVEQKREHHPSSELEMDKELGLDKLAVPPSFNEPNQVRNKRKLLERLDSDAQKLNTLQVTVDELRRKLETSKKKKKKAKSVDFETVKEQLEEVEETIVQLAEVNSQLTRKIEVGPLQMDGKALSPEMEAAGNFQRKRVSEQARKGSEKIGRLQLEVQKIQYVLLKLDDEKKSKGKLRLARSGTSIILKNFIYNAGKSSPRRKKGNLCGCFKHSTPGDGNSINVFH
ncbi:hypothetical protein RHGRI_012268 [Rhododendron griersonianum]|uniref:NAB domain-containing protein n=1 Tax=Rhododendron griersonianum TaxID=479676 RepID=A0AAV6KQ55_9ERIC|nr:hypothetical protein RHGRI_012268 [Rhododendron griersonianum]KAG5554656.1 hypothetical protein RHGRI_012268 [Rhododendron griersonianum]